MSDEIKLALTREEWRRVTQYEKPGDARTDTNKLTFGGNLADCDCCGCFSYPRHMVAALALHGQPFGFTHEDLDLLRGVADTNAVLGPMGRNPRLLRLAERIAALLPPP